MSRTTMAERASVESRRVHQVYQALARFYDAGFDWALGPGRRLAVRRLATEAGERVLEVGVGTGLSLPFYPEDVHVTGIDISEAMLLRARERVVDGVPVQVELRTMDARELSFADAAFDHVLLPYVISVVPEPERVMAEIARVVRPGGTVVVVNHFGHERRWIRTVERLLSPLSQWIGFRLDLPIETVTDTAGLTVESLMRVNMLGWWRLIEMRRNG